MPVFKTEIKSVVQIPNQRYTARVVFAKGEQRYPSDSDFFQTF